MYSNSVDIATFIEQSPSTVKRYYLNRKNIPKLLDIVSKADPIRFIYSEHYLVQEISLKLVCVYCRYEEPLKLDLEDIDPVRVVVSLSESIDWLATEGVISCNLTLESIVYGEKDMVMIDLFQILSESNSDKILFYAPDKTISESDRNILVITLIFFQLLHRKFYKESFTPPTSLDSSIDLDQFIATIEESDFLNRSVKTFLLEELESKIDNLPRDLQSYIRRLRGLLDLSLFVGDGITQKEFLDLYKFRKVEGGKFLMGSDHLWGSSAPSHYEEVKDFWIGEIEIKQSIWNHIGGENRAIEKNDDLPIYNISWREANQFIKILNSSTKLNFRLPTEVEWEYAARGGEVGDKRVNMETGVCDMDMFWSRDNSEELPKRSYDLTPNRLGIYSMCGNVWEWCSDHYEAYDSAKELVLFDRGRLMVTRGGSAKNLSSSCSIYIRNGIDLDSAVVLLFSGFRLVLDHDPTKKVEI